MKHPTVLCFLAHGPDPSGTLYTLHPSRRPPASCAGSLRLTGRAENHGVPRTGCPSAHCRGLRPALSCVAQKQRRFRKFESSHLEHGFDTFLAPDRSPERLQNGRKLGASFVDLDSCRSGTVFVRLSVSGSGRRLFIGVTTMIASIWVGERFESHIPQSLFLSRSFRDKPDAVRSGLPTGGQRAHRSGHHLPAHL